LKEHELGILVKTFDADKRVRIRAGNHEWVIAHRVSIASLVAQLLR